MYSSKKRMNINNIVIVITHEVDVYVEIIKGINIIK